MKKNISKNMLKEYIFCFLVFFLMFFMILIFGPAEIFFANVTEFEFVYGEFAGALTLIATLLSGIFAGIVLLVGSRSKVLGKIILSGSFTVSLAGYLQVMFMNRRLDLLGQNPEGYWISKKVALANGMVWLAIFVVVTVLAYKKADIWKMLLQYVTSFLLVIQGVALISLLLTAGEEAYRRPKDAWYLSGEEQFVVSSKENIIVLVLDYYSNQYIEQTQKYYPDMIDFLNDFTYYSNANVDYFGTFPSMTSTFAGVEFDPSILINDWCYRSWTNEKTISFYDEMRTLGYKCNMFSSGDEYLCGANDRKILENIFFNTSNETREPEVSYKLLLKTMTKMSCYRMMPELFKPLFYTNESEYADIIEYKTTGILHSNYKFYDKLIKEGLSVSDESNYFIVQHLSGGHEFNNDENCLFNEEVRYEDTYMGAMVMVEEYLNQLKQLGVYDAANIIVTSDHGGPLDSQPIFFVKEPGESHAEMQVTNAPITLRELLPTIAKMAGADYEKYGQTIYDFSPDEKRERTYWYRYWDANYNTDVLNYSHTASAVENIYRIYTYTGDFSDLKYQTDNDIFEVYQMIDSFYVE